MSARVSAWFGLALGGLVGSLGACRELVVGEAVDYVSALGQELEFCIGEEPAWLRPSLEVSDGDEAAARAVDGFLRAAIEARCLDGCREAQRCLDLAPVCGGASTRCESDARCCGASERLGRCDEDTRLCCGLLGAECEGDGECCDGELCQPTSSGARRCGGVECSRIRASCTSNIDCCSRRCEDGVCEASVCAELGGKCRRESDCCGAGDGTVSCDEGVCVGAPQACVACNPLDADNCCTLTEERCYERFDGQTTCGSPTCAPLDVGCGSDADCCPGEGAVCRRGPFPHCSRVCGAGVEEQCCVAAGLACSAASECCSGSCLGGLCRAFDPGCEPVTCHSPEVVGAPLDASCDGLDGVEASELDRVCKDQPSCCCVRWTASCIAAYGG